VDARLGCLHRIVLIVDRRGGAGEVVDPVDLHIEREADIVAHQLETWVLAQRDDVAAGAGEKVVDAQHLVAVGQQPLTEMRAQKSGAAGYEYSVIHFLQPFR